MLYNSLFTSFTLEYKKQQGSRRFPVFANYRAEELTNLPRIPYKRPAMWNTSGIRDRYEMKGLYAKVQQHIHARETLLHTLSRPLYVDGVRYTALERVRDVVRRGVELSTVIDVPPTNTRVRAMFFTMGPVAESKTTLPPSSAKNPLLSDIDAIYVEVLCEVLDDVDPDDEAVSMKTIDVYLADMQHARMERCEQLFYATVRRMYGKTALLQFQRERMGRYLYTYANNYLCYYLSKKIRTLPSTQSLLNKLASDFPVYQDAVQRGDVLVLAEAITCMRRKRELQTMKAQMRVNEEMISEEIASREQKALEAERELRTAKQKRQIDQIALLNRFRVMRVAGDGNCLYNAFLTSLHAQHKPPYGDDGMPLQLKRDVPVLRNAIADLLEANPLPADVFEGTDVAIPKPATIRQEGEWGGDLELALLSRLYGVDIRVLLKDGSYIDYSYENTRKTYARLPDDATYKDYDKPRAIVHLVFSEVENMRNTGHYDAMIYDVSRSDEVLEYMYSSTTGVVYKREDDATLKRAGIWNPLELTLTFDSFDKKKQVEASATDLETIRFHRFGERIYYGVSSTGGL